MKRPLVLGLDLSLVSTGVAHVDETLSTIKTKKLRGVERLSFIELKLIPCIGKADLVAIEGYSYGSRGRSIFDIGELGGIVRLACWKASTPFIEIPPAVVKKRATGYGNSTKDEVMKAALNAGAKPVNSDEADAFWIRLMGVESACNS